MLFIVITISLHLITVLCGKRNTTYKYTKQPAVFVRKKNTHSRSIELARFVREHHKKMYKIRTNELYNIEKFSAIEMREIFLEKKIIFNSLYRHLDK